MARTSGAATDPVEPVEEEVLGPEDAEIEAGEDASTDADETGGDGVDGDDGDEGEAEGEEAEDDVAPEPRRGGGSQTIRAQRARAQAAERELAEVKRQIAELQGFQAGATSRQQQPDPQAAQRAEAEFYAQLELMPPAQAYQAIVHRERQNIGGALQQLRLEQQDLADQARYEASCARSPTREAYREKVEDYRQSQLRRGFIISREEAYHLLLGRDTEARASRAAPRQRAAAAARVAGQRTQPTGARSNMRPGGRRPQPGSAEADAAAIAEADARGIKIW
jgi:hypothetical protein